ncbi:BatD family protein [Hydrogenimonas sp.]
MRRNHGDRRYIWFLALLLPVWIWAANVHIEVDKPEVTRGDTVTFTIRAQGGDVEFPTVREIGKYPILGTAKSSSISIVNGSVKRSFTKSYTFAPMEDVTIPPLEVKVDGRTLQTKPLEIHVVDVPSAASSKAEAQLLISLDKNEAKVGEPVEMNVTIRYRPDAGFVQLEMPKVQLGDFWVKKVSDPIDDIDRGYRIKKERYLIFPQKAGDFKIGPLIARIAKKVRIRQPFGNDPFFNDFFTQLKWIRIASNAQTLHVAPLPGGVELYGDFDIEAKADKTEVDANKPVRVTIRIEGEGNIDDIEKFDPKISDAVVYADEPKIVTRLSNGRYGGTFTQTITVVADRDFTFPSLSLRYYDADKKRIVEKRTQPIHVHVKGGVKQKSVKHSTSQKEPGSGEKENIPVSKESASTVSVPVWLSFGGGFILGAAILWIFMHYAKRFKRVKKEEDIVDRILDAKDDKALLELILPYSMKDEELKEIARRLEGKIFGKEKYKADKKQIASIVADILKGDVTQK